MDECGSEFIKENQTITQFQAAKNIDRNRGRKEKSSEMHRY